ncbi:hypothetical protein AB3Y40_09340 [Yoonia sp. R2331]|uniref:hypothetical protein n=1 Tax=Yoonia sp. R2331 TaxID=3237238 RepID=UPI0034E3C341
MKRLISTLFALGLMATGASAATVNYNFQAGGPNGSSVSYTSGGVDLTVSSGGGNVAVTNNGLGVTGNPEGGRLGLGESLTFDFGGILVDQISGLVFEAGPQAEQFGVIINGVSTLFTVPAGLGNSFTTLNFSSLIPTGGVSSFTIFGVQPNAPGNRGVKVGGITVNAINIPPVPLPAGGALLLTGLGLLALRRRR